MAAAIFDSACDELERATGLDRLVVRGTLRLALKSVGLEPAALTKAQLELVAQKVLPDELKKRGVTDAERLCLDVTARLVDTSSRRGPESPDDIFRRLGAR